MGGRTWSRELAGGQHSSDSHRAVGEARMSRRSRLHVPGGVYYVVQRSNARQPIFTEEADYATFERLLSTMLVRCRVRAHAYCWETDAIHLVLQISDMPVGRLMQRLSSQYARRVHRRAGEL